MKSKIKIFTLFCMIAIGFVWGTGLVFGAGQSNRIFADDEDNSILPSAYCIRDEYYLQTTNQYNQGLCWDFASSTAFTINVMKSTNQYIDYSEGWVSNEMATLSRNYNPGSGGYFMAYTESIKRSGIVQEQDFNYEDSYQLTRENASHYYEYYSQFADTTIVKNYNDVTILLDANHTEEEKQDFMMQVKHHILQQGGLYVDFGWASSSAMIGDHRVDFRDPIPTTYSSAHALCVVGWDDDIEVLVHGEYLYKGAWIFINSWGYGGGDKGMYYLFYDDPKANRFQGYEYVEEYDDLYFFNKLTNSNAYFLTEFKGAYTGNFEATTAETKQKNVFYNTNIPTLTYSYTISDNTNIDDIKIFCKQTDVTKDFNIYTNTDTITISAKNELEVGAYKIVWTYSNLTETESICGAFYILDYTEFADIRFNSNNQSINKSGSLQLNGMYHHGYDYMMYGITEDDVQQSLAIQFYPSVYSKINQVFIKNADTEEIIASATFTPNYNYLHLNCTFNFDEQLTYNLCMKTSTNVERIYKLYFKMVDLETQSFSRVIYSLDGGINSPNNQKSVVIGNTEQIEIEKPTKEGYGFAGWYYSKDFDGSAMLKTVDGKFYLESDKIIHYENASTYWTKNEPEITEHNFKGFIVYAKWVKLEEGKTYHTITAMVTGNGYISETGILFVEHGTDKHFDINSVGYNIIDCVIDNQIASNVQILSLQNYGLTFENVTEDHYFTFKFLPRTDTPFKVNYYFQSLNETEYCVDDKFYYIANTETFTGTTDEMTDIIATDYPHFILLEFEQQIIMPDGSTVINIYYDREIYNLTLSFIGIKNNSTEFDIDEDLLFGENRTYTIKLLGYIVSQCKIDGEITNYDKSISLENINKNYNIEVYVEECLHKITYEYSQNGTVQCSGSSRNVKDGDTRHFYVIAQDGYFLKEVLVNGEKIETDENGEFSLLIDKNMKINAVFEQKKKPSVVDNPIILGELGLVIVILSAIIIKTLLDRRLVQNDDGMTREELNRIREKIEKNQKK